MNRIAGLAEMEFLCGLVPREKKVIKTCRIKEALGPLPWWTHDRRTPAWAQNRPGFSSHIPFVF
jgi:hypothetical protein